LQVGIHACCWIEEESSQQLRSFLGVDLIALEVVGECECFNCRFHLIFNTVIIDLVDLWIAFAVAANVGEPICTFGIRPKVRRLTHVVVLVAAGRCDVFCDYGEWTSRQFLLRVAFKFGERWRDAGLR